MAAMSPRISAAWTEKPETRQLNCWLCGCLPENGLVERYRPQAQSMLKPAGVPSETPKVLFGWNIDPLAGHCCAPGDIARTWPRTRQTPVQGNSVRNPSRMLSLSNGRTYA